MKTQIKYFILGFCNVIIKDLSGTPKIFGFPNQSCTCLRFVSSNGNKLLFCGLIRLVWFGVVLRLLRHEAEAAIGRANVAFHTYNASSFTLQVSYLTAKLQASEFTQHSQHKDVLASFSRSSFVLPNHSEGGWFRKTCWKAFINTHGNITQCCLIS